MKNLLLIFMLISCGKLTHDIRGVDKIEANVNHNINLDLIVDFCNEYYEGDIQECVENLSGLFNSFINDEDIE